MSLENVKKFYEVVTQDETIRQKFIQQIQTYQGVAGDLTKVNSIIEQDMLPLANQMGYDFTLDELKAFDKEMRQGHEVDLTDEELVAVVGGLVSKNECIILGDYHSPTSNQGITCVGLGFGSEGSFCFVAGDFKYTWN